MFTLLFGSRSFLFVLDHTRTRIMVNSGEALAENVHAAVEIRCDFVRVTP